MITLKEKLHSGISYVGTLKDKIKDWINYKRGRAESQLQSDEMKSLSSRLSYIRGKVRLRVALPVMAAIIAVGALIIYTQVRVFHSYRIVSSVERSDDSSTNYVRLANRTLKCNPNGVTCVNDANTVQWNVTFTMQSPIVDMCQSTVAVADQRGQDVYVFDKNGQIGHFEVEHTLLKVCVAAQGVVAAVLEDGEITWINVYDSQGTLIVGIRTSMSDLGYPLSVDISPDGQRLAIAYLTMDNNDIMTRVAFYNFSSVGQNEEDHLVNKEEYPGKIVSEINFLDNSHAVAFRDDGLSFYSGRQVPEEKSTVTVEQEMISVFHSDKYVGFIVPSDEEDQTHKYKMQIYRATGSKCGTEYFDSEYTDAALRDDEIILHGNHTIEIYQMDGKCFADVEYEKQIVDVIKVGGLHQYEIVTPDSTDKIKMK